MSPAEVQRNEIRVRYERACDGRLVLTAKQWADLARACLWAGTTMGVTDGERRRFRARAKDCEARAASCATS